MRIKKTNKTWGRSTFRLDDNLVMGVENVQLPGMNWSFEGLVFTRTSKGKMFQFTIKAELIPNLMSGLKTLLSNKQ